MVIAAGIGAATTGVGAVLGAAAAKKQKKEAESNARRALFLEEQANSINELDNFESQGLDGVDYYAYGGAMKTPNQTSLSNGKTLGGFTTEGGALVPIGDGVEKAIGNKHAENKIGGTYGIKVNQNGMPVAEIEDGEIVADGNVVYSDQMMYDKNNTYADKMEKITMQRNKLDKKLEGLKKPRQRNGVERQLASLNMAEEALFNKQEMAKLAEGTETLESLAKGGKINKMATGGNFKDIASQVAPQLIDNVINGVITANTPKIATPLMNRAANLKTDYNVNPQIAANRRAVAAQSNTVLNNTSNSANARNAIAKANLAGELRESDIYAQKENYETQLENQNRINRQQVTNANTNLVNQNLDRNYQRAAGIGSAISANAANLSSDINNAAAFVAKDKRESEKLLIEAADDPTGAKARAFLSLPSVKERLMKDPAYKETLKKNPVFANLFRDENFAAQTNFATPRNKVNYNASNSSRYNTDVA